MTYTSRTSHVMCFCTRRGCVLEFARWSKRAQWLGREGAQQQAPATTGTGEWNACAVIAVLPVTPDLFFYLYVCNSRSAAVYCSNKASMFICTRTNCPMICACVSIIAASASNRRGLS